ncbi:hypothetical protein, conserved [Eimeria maxima]|uniref:C-CAP/cofactor C-like domain-containing protein n=1 Tax=Eimeria maxima TaxID=5804 RepID=U6M555_EIMMA|nr:hypothetical protein, conserved [Eimeria maxima]CDJ59372.1 hypothetical protein, conserved [Eimeria maxima]
MAQLNTDKLFSHSNPPSSSAAAAAAVAAAHLPSTTHKSQDHRLLQPSASTAPSWLPETSYRHLAAGSSLNSSKLISSSSLPAAAAAQSTEGPLMGAPQFEAPIWGAPPFRLSMEAVDFISAIPAPEWSVLSVVSHCLGFLGAPWGAPDQLKGSLRQDQDPAAAAATAAAKRPQPIYVSLRQWRRFNAGLATSATCSSRISISSSSTINSSRLKQKTQMPPALKDNEVVAIWGAAAALAFLHTRKKTRRHNLMQQQQQQQQQQQGQTVVHDGFPSLYYPSAAAAAADAAAAATAANEYLFSGTSAQWDSSSHAAAAAAATAATATPADAAAVDAGLLRAAGLPDMPPLLEAQEEVVEVRVLFLLLLLLAARRQQQQQQQNFPVPEEPFFSSMSSPRRALLASTAAAADSFLNEGNTQTSLPNSKTQHTNSGNLDSNKIRQHLLQYEPQLLQLLRCGRRCEQQQPQKEHPQQQQQDANECLAAFEMEALEVFLECDIMQGLASSLSGGSSPLLPFKLLPKGVLRHLLRGLTGSYGAATLTDKQQQAALPRRSQVRNLKGALQCLNSAALRSSRILRISSCSNTDIFISWPVEALVLEGLSGCSVVAPVVVGPVFVRSCCRLTLHTRANAVFVDNTLGADLFVACCFPPVLLGGSRALSLGPYNVICRPPQQQMQQQQVVQEQHQEVQQQQQEEEPANAPRSLSVHSP